MSSFFREGDKFSHHGIRGSIFKITETYRKNVLVIKVSELPKKNPFFIEKNVEMVGFFEYPDGTIEFMSLIE